MYIYIYIYIYMYIHICTYKYAYICICICIYSYMYVYMCIHVYIYIYIHKCIHIYVFHIHIYLYDNLGALGGMIIAVGGALRCVYQIGVGFVRTPAALFASMAGYICICVYACKYLYEYTVAFFAN
jgi:hypothetical protein